MTLLILCIHTELFREAVCGFAMFVSGGGIIKVMFCVGSTPQNAPNRCISSKNEIPVLNPDYQGIHPVSSLTYAARSSQKWLRNLLSSPHTLMEVGTLFQFIPACVKKYEIQPAMSDVLLSTVQPNASHFYYWIKRCLSRGNHTPSRHGEGASSFKEPLPQFLCFSFSPSISSYLTVNFSPLVQVLFPLFLETSSVSSNAVQ